jgi:hypothetical protein
MKASQGEIKQRIVIKENKTEGILNYDLDNAYPQRMNSIIGASGTAMSCVGLLSKFVRGKGFADTTFYKAKINEYGLTLDKLLRKNSIDYARFSGFAVHVNYNALFKRVSYNYVPWENCRLTPPDDKDHKDMIALYSDWARLKKKNILKENIVFIDVYNPDPEVIAEQVENAGGWSNYKGQIFWYSPEGMEYPVAPYDAVTEDIITDAGIKNFRKRSVKNRFMASHLFLYPGKFEDDTQRDLFVQELTEFQGDEKSNRIMMVDEVDNDNKPELIPIESPDADKMFASTTRTAKDSIIECFGQPPILLGVQIAGKLGTADEIRDATKFYDDYTADDRIIFEECYTELFKDFHENINPSGDYSIIPISGLVQAAAKPALITVFGIGGTQALTGILSDTTLSPEQKVNALKIIFGLSEEEAQALVKGTPIEV